MQKVEVLHDHVERSEMVLLDRCMYRTLVLLAEHGDCAGGVGELDQDVDNYPNGISGVVYECHECEEKFDGPARSICI